jgi:adenine-specific DNA-methyltransferase
MTGGQKPQSRQKITAGENMPTLNWLGKDKVINHHQKVPYRILEPQYTHGSGDTNNMLIHGDNLDALKALLPRYEGRIACIYIDPPYNTGNEGWVYNDNVKDPKMLKWLGEAVGREGEDLSRHDKWLCMMYPRLRLLQRLLADDGAIFVSIDNNEVFNLKLLCDEIFGCSNFIDCIAVINNLKGRSDGKYIATAHENMLIYQKGDFLTNGVPVPEEYDKEYKLNDEHGRYRLQGLRKRGTNSRRVDRPNMWYPFYFSAVENRLSLNKAGDGDIEIYPYLSGKAAQRPSNSQELEGRWRWSASTAQERIDELTAQLVKGRNEYDIFQKDYITDEKRIKPKSFWSGPEFSAEAGTLEVKNILGMGLFSTPKSTGIIEYILEQATNPGDIILDSFAGSGTTAHAALKLNRRFILVEMEDYAETITAERIRRVIDGYSNTDGTGGGFTYYELGERLLLENGNLNENIGEDKIREYVWHTETRQDYTSETPPYLGECGGAAYYFHYAENAVTTLDKAFLKTITRKAERYVIYADKNALSDGECAKYNIVFKKIPRDIAKI